jgi:hypothetical protein
MNPSQRDLSEMRIISNKIPQPYLHNASLLEDKNPMLRLANKYLK